MGFVKDPHRNSRDNRVLHDNYLNDRLLTGSGCSWLLPVISGYGGDEPGQKRDKSGPTNSPFGGRFGSPASLAIALAFMLFAAVSSAATMMPRTRGAVYARHSTGEQKSVPDQVRECRDWAAANSVHVADEMIFTDSGVTGRTHRRAGLDKLIQALDQNTIDVVIVLQTSRLFRKLYRTLWFVAEQIVDRRKRIVFITQNIDTAKDDRWQYMLPVLGMIDELRANMTKPNIHAAHKGLHREKRVWGTRTFGYRGQVIEGKVTNKGRNARQWEIDPTEKRWVILIFGWLIKRGLSPLQIARRLNEKGAPLSPKCVNGHWTRMAVQGVLRNPRYKGEWPYGTREGVWMNGAGYTRQIARETPLDLVFFEELRIVDNTTWGKAQETLAGWKSKPGLREKDSESRTHLHILNGLCVCEKHQRPLWVGGANGDKMVCPSCQTDPDRALFSMLSRQKATEQICSLIASLINSDQTVIADQVIAQCQQHIAAMQKADPDELHAVRRQEERLSKQITFIQRSPGDTDEDMAENLDLLKRYQQERAQLRSKREHLESKNGHALSVPTREALQLHMKRMADILRRAAESGDSLDAAAAKRIITAISGGKIVISQQGDRRAKRGWLRASFTINLISPLLEQLNLPSHIVNDAGSAVSVDMKDASVAEELADEAKDLEDSGLLVIEIANDLSRRHGRRISRTIVTQSLKHWYESRSLVKPDGRARRAELGKLPFGPAIYNDPKIVERVMSLYDEGSLLDDIASSVGIDRNIVTKTVREWHTQRGLQVPDGRARRKSLSMKSRKRSVDGEVLPNAARSDKGPPSS